MMIEIEAEQLWLHAIDGLYGIRKQVIGDKKVSKKERNFFNTFILIRLQIFMKSMSEHVTFRNIIVFLESIG